MSNPIDANIPVLTDVILPQEQAAAAIPVAASAAASVAPAVEEHAEAPAADKPAAVPAAAISGEEWARLEQTIRENVLKQVLARVDFVLEHRVRDSLADVLQTAVEHLATDIRAGLHKTMEEVVTRAITQEISKAKMSK
ncbi:hypothetical protein [Undibacterium sp.]|jgi:hypothetical protein|uniref:hypothetical protein n=1 Tax=Undibacterium sp. TaxID=1914977 RepID=UPI002BE28A04|nr:hypothetical protein [Undibacterium sp.]HTD05398.1 hypothetical protein [Undibacterium sp.]